MKLRVGLLVLLLVAVARPAPASELTFPAGVDVVRLPARFVNHHIIVRVTIGGRGLDMVLDSGASAILLDEAVATQLGSRGRSDTVRALGGVVDARRARLAETTIGRLTLRDAIALATPFHYDADLRTRAVGLLGAEFIERCVLRIDYARGTVDAIRPEAFRLPAAGHTITLEFDQGVPLVTMSLNGVEGDRFVLDTGADLLTVFPGFAAMHDAAVASITAPVDADAESEAGRAHGVGGEPSQRNVVLAEARFAGERFARVHAIVIDHRPLQVEGREFDGLLGNAILEHFVVYLDFARGRIVLEPAPGRRTPERS